jgi:hypothetical protein
MTIILARERVYLPSNDMAPYPNHVCDEFAETSLNGSRLAGSPAGGCCCGK